MNEMNSQNILGRLRWRYATKQFDPHRKISPPDWAALESAVVDKVFLYYAPKILGGLDSLPMAGGIGRLRRDEAILLERTALHPIPPDEFAVEAWVRRNV